MTFAFSIALETYSNSQSLSHEDALVKKIYNDPLFYIVPVDSGARYDHARIYDRITHGCYNVRTTGTDISPLS